MSDLSVQSTTLEDIESMRESYRREMNCQIIHDSIHARPGWSAEYLLVSDGTAAGYGSIAIAGPWKEKPTLYEFFVLPEFRARMFDLFSALLDSTNVKYIETQTNDPLLTTMLFAFAETIVSESILFHDKLKTSLAPHGATFRPATATDYPDAPANWLPAHGVVEWDGVAAGKGGILFHYNPPYGDIYMEVSEAFRQQGLGAYLVQELKRVCYQRGNIPAARCNPTNFASRATLQKAGFVPCGHIVTGTIRNGAAE